MKTLLFLASFLTIFILLYNLCFAEPPIRVPALADFCIETGPKNLPVKKYRCESDETIYFLFEIKGKIIESIPFIYKGLARPVEQDMPDYRGGTRM